MPRRSASSLGSFALAEEGDVPADQTVENLETLSESAAKFFSDGDGVPNSGNRYAS